MANVLSPVKLKNNPSREGFDLSSKRNFTAKVGELLPVWHKFVLPGDTINIDLKSFTRTKPLNTAAFARLREYYDFYFVPLDLLWNRSSEVISQMLANKTHANGRLYSDNISYSGDLPYVTTLDLAKFCTSATGTYKNNLFGFNFADVTAKLYQYLGYGNFYKIAKRETVATSISGTNLQQSLYPALAYQKIYNDFFRYQQWENSQPWTFNVDFMKGTNDLNFFNGYDFASHELLRSSNPFTLRYVNYQKDLFRGILPRAQYGRETVVQSSFSGGSIRVSSATGIGLKANQALLTSINSDGFALNQIQAQSSNGSMTPVGFNAGSFSSSFSILALRQAQALQKWKEISIANNEDVAAQIEAHWGVDVSQYLSDKCRWLGGTSANLDINEVTNTNLADSNAANLAGKGIISNGSQINFTSKAEYGIIMCVYHSEPIVDYVTSGVDLNNTIVSATDFPIPEFDRIGMEVLQKEYLINPIDSSEASPTDFKNVPPSLGYVPRYVRWKTDIDRSYGDFSESLRSWILPFTDSDVLIHLRDATNATPDSEENPNVPPANFSDGYYDVTYGFFKVNPHVVDDLFVVASDSTVQTDQLEVSSYFDAKFVRNLDRDGLPY